MHLPWHCMPGLSMHRSYEVTGIPEPYEKPHEGWKALTLLVALCSAGNVVVEDDKVRGIAVVVGVLLNLEVVGGCRGQVREDLCV